MMLTFAQIDAVKEVINTNDATITGVLIAVIMIYNAAVIMLWRKMNTQEEYIKSQDKENLKMIYTVTGTVDSFGVNINDIKGVTRDNNLKADKILTIVQERLKTMNNGHV